MPACASEAEAGELACGTIDSFLIWRLTGGRVHATDRSNASRTLLLNLHRRAWDEDLCRYFDVPRRCCRRCGPARPTSARRRALDFLPDGVPIAGVAGDQQAALFGQCGFAAGRGEMYLRHRGVLPAAPRRPADAVAASAADDPGGER